MSEKLSSKDRENLQKLTKDQIQDIIKDKMADAKVELEDKLSATIDEAMEEIDRKTDKETNNKIMEISQYSDTVLESVDKSHKEVTFMYSMLNEKQQDTVDMTKKLSELEDTLVALDSSIAKKLDILRDKEIELEEMKKEQKEFVPLTESSNKPVSFTEALAEKFADDTPNIKQNGNMEILTLHDEGLSEVEIAKKLGRGLGEVKFVLGLYQEGR
ncbi:DUF6115 domain-containing protein [Pseudobutyrivibrio sp.]|uniref:DUF6115 domain-containing protein n=1 Tax=Pseudobutyrivibrio sp. TaxID=2014367 RepID=UPI001B4E30F2|nr:DUF6115 domain-containing protein [Pseudobutyrivibrio sp.]MBP3260784.1 hypothetical protein [Pseudobutyrivibrio sp.]